MAVLGSAAVSSTRFTRVVCVAFGVVACGVVVGACGFDGEGTLDVSTSATSPGAPAPGHSSLPPAGKTDAAAPPVDAAPPVPACTDPTLSFDGVDDFALVPDDNALDLGNDFTVEAWIKPGANVAGGAEMDIVSHHDANASQGWALFVKSGRVEIVVWGSENFASAAYSAGNSGATYVTANKWAHVAGTRSGDTLRIYYDGVLRDTQQLAFLFGRDNYRGALRIGRAAYVDDFRFQGEIDDIRLSKTARYTGNTAPKPTASLSLDDQTVASWTFDETSGTKIVDGMNAHNGSFAPDTTAPTRVASECIAHR